MANVEIVRTTKRRVSPRGTLKPRLRELEQQFPEIVESVTSCRFRYSAEPGRADC